MICNPCEKTAYLNPPQLGLTYNNIGVFHFDVGGYLGAIKYHTKASKIQQRSLQCDHAEFVMIYEYIPLVRYCKSNHSKLWHIYRQALELRNTYLPSDHVNFAICYETMAMYHAVNRQHGAAQGYRLKAFDIRNNHPSTAHPEFTLIDSELDLLRRILQTEDERQSDTIRHESTGKVS